MALDGTSGKKYGLTIPNKKLIKEPIRINPTENAFGEESDEEEEANFKQPTFDVKMETIKASLRKTVLFFLNVWVYYPQTKINLEKALEEDASVFQYDEIYDEITREKDQKLSQKNLPSARKSKYVDKLLQASAVRKLEKELLTERKAQRELEAEREKYGDKESFKKMAELRELVERRREEEAREEIMDVTKQDGLGGFYRYMFQQKTASRRISPPTSTSFEVSEPQIGSSDKDTNDERSSRRIQSPSPPRRRHKDEDAKGERSPSSPTRRPSLPRRENDYRPRCREHRRHPDETLSPSPWHRHHHRRSDSGGHRSHRNGRRHSGSRSRHAHHDDWRRREDGGREGEGKAKQDRSSTEASSSKKGEAISKTTVLPPASKLSPPPPGFIHAKPRKTTEEEVDAARQRFMARKAAGLTRPTVVVSDDEA
ncbi:Nuclear speckle splicing regulatory protein 1 [Taenia solium]|eukprot:TsM_000638900 transcript=TsM_000638900 gene=TsM_000638900